MAVVVKSRKESDVFSPFTAEVLAEFVKSSGESELLTPWRKDCFARALISPAPTSKDEDFKYIDFRLLDFRELKPEHLQIIGNDNGLPATVQAISSERIPHLPVKFALPESHQGDDGTVYFGSYDAAAAAIPEELAGYLEFFNGNFPQRKLVHLAHAFLSQGVFLHIGRNVQLQTPRQVFTHLTESRVMTSVSGLVVVEDNARAGLIWDTASAAGTVGFHNGTLDVVMKSGSKLELMLSQDFVSQIDSVMTVRVYLEKDAEIDLLTLNSGGRLNQMEVDLQFAGEGSSATLNGIYVGHNQENFNLLTHQDHRVGHCKSDLLYIGTLAGTAKSNYLGKITIAPNAQRSDAYQKNRNLVLNKGVSVNTSPKLEIRANDVRCSHGATTARISDLEMFYLRSRGIDKSTAKVLLADGFLRQVAQRLHSPVLKQAFDQRLSALLTDWGVHDS